MASPFDAPLWYNGNKSSEDENSTDLMINLPLQNRGALYHTFLKAGAENVPSDKEYLELLNKRYNAGRGLVRPGLDLWHDRYDFGLLPTLPQPCIPHSLSREAVCALINETGYLHGFQQQAAGNHQDVGERRYIVDFREEAMRLEPL